MKLDIYITPDCDCVPVEAGGPICGSTAGTGDSFGNGSDYGGKDKWEGIRW